MSEYDTFPVAMGSECVMADSLDGQVSMVVGIEGGDWPRSPKRLSDNDYMDERKLGQIKVVLEEIRHETEGGHDTSRHVSGMFPTIELSDSDLVSTTGRYNVSIGSTAFAILCETATYRLHVKTIAIGFAL